jgi:hypothetical protein
VKIQRYICESSIRASHGFLKQISLTHLLSALVLQIFQAAEGFAPQVAAAKL